MLDHYYTPRDPLPAEQMIHPQTPHLLPDFDPGATEKPTGLAPRAVVDLTSLDLEQIAFDCDSDSDSGSDDGYVSTLLRLQRHLPLINAPRKIAGARRVARAVSSPQPVRTAMMDMEMEPHNGTRRSVTPEGEIFQSITAIPGLESTSFEELRLETYLQSLIATGSSRPQPAFAPALVIPPAFSAQFCEWDKDAANGDVDMTDVNPTPSPAQSAHPPFIFRAASFPPAHTEVTWK